MKILTGVFSPWGRLYTTLFGSLLGGGHSNDPQADSQERRKKVATIAVVVIIASLVSLFITMLPHSPKINRAPFIGLGEALADETAKAINNHGTVVPVMTDYYTSGGAPMTDEWKTFARAIKKHNGITLAAPVMVKLEEGMGEPGVTRADFDALVTKHAKDGALVLFVGLPVWDAKDPLTLPPTAPKIIAVHNTPMSVKLYFSNSIATALVTSRMVPDPDATGEPQTPRQWFNKYFQIVTAQNYQTLPD